MIKLRTLILFIPFLALIGCSDSEDPVNYITSKPVASECLLASNVVSQSYTIHEPSLIEGGWKSIDVKYSSEYDYDGDLVTAYRYSRDATTVDTLNNSNNDVSGYQFDFTYEGNLLSKVSSGNTDIMTVQNVDGKIHSMTLYEEIDYIFTYDGGGNITEIVAESSGIDSVLSVRLEYQTNNLTKMEYYVGETRVLEHQYAYFEDIKNPYYGAIFYVISLIEIQGEFYDMDYSVFSPSLNSSIELGELTNDGLWLSGIPAYEDTREYTKNSKGFPTSSTPLTIEHPQGIYTVVESQTYGYTNCD